MTHPPSSLCHQQTIVYLRIFLDVDEKELGVSGIEVPNSTRGRSQNRGHLFPEMALLQQSG